MRTFDTGATRDVDENKVSYYKLLSPQVLKRYGEYMLAHQVQADGSKRDFDNWKKGIPQDVYTDSLVRHVVELWDELQGANRPVANDTLCAIIFNAMGLLHERLLGRDVGTEAKTLVEPKGRVPYGLSVKSLLDELPEQTFKEFLETVAPHHVPTCSLKENIKRCDHWGRYKREVLGDKS